MRLGCRVLGFPMLDMKYRLRHITLFATEGSDGKIMLKPPAAGP
jgi:hypothetical protein